MITNEMALQAIKNELNAGNFESVINTVKELMNVVDRRGEMNERLLKLNGKLLKKCSLQIEQA